MNPCPSCDLKKYLDKLAKSRRKEPTPAERLIRVMGSRPTIVNEDPSNIFGVEKGQPGIYISPTWASSGDSIFLNPKPDPKMLGGADKESVLNHELGHRLFNLHNQEGDPDGVPSGTPKEDIRSAILSLSEQTFYPSEKTAEVVEDLLTPYDIKKPRGLSNFSGKIEGEDVLKPFVKKTWQSYPIPT